MIYEEYFMKYTGKGVSVALIDTGVMIEQENVFHYRYQDGSIVDCDIRNVESTHGTMCADVMLRLAPNVNLFDICIEFNGAIKESALINALDFAYLNLESDVICICLALNDYSSELYHSLEKFNNVFILASGYKEKLSYPADLSNIIKVYFDQDADILSIVSDNIIESNCHFEKYKSHSIASAFVTGLLSLYLEAHALWSFIDVRNSLFPTEAEEIKLGISAISMPENFVAYFPQKYLDYKDCFINNIIGYCDSDMSKYTLEGKPILDKHEVIHINPFEHYRTPTIHGDYFAGNYVNSTLSNKITLLDHYAVSSEYICEISQPIIAIASFGYGSSKFDLQLGLYSGITKLGYNTKCFAYNPVGILFKDFIVFEYPKQILCPNIIYSINRVIYESSLKENVDVFLLNIAGSIRPINFHNAYDMGMLFESYMKAFRIDIVLLCVAVDISIETILYEIERLKSTGIAEVIVVVSETQYDITTYDSATGIKYFNCSKTKQQDYFERLREQYHRGYVYVLSELNCLDVAKLIIQKLT